MISTKYARDELSFKTYEEAVAVGKILLDNEYVVLLSREEDLYILNYLYSEDSDRNNVAFLSEGEFYDRYLEKCEDDDPDADLEKFRADMKEEETRDESIDH